MTNYIAHYRKKLDTLARNEAALIRIVEQGSNELEVTRAVEKVRASAVRVLNAYRAQLAPSGETDTAIFVQIDDEIKEVMAMSNDEIVARSRQKCKRRHK